MQDLQERIDTNMQEACSKIGPRTIVLTVHGTADDSVPVSNASLYHKALPGSQLELLEGTDHTFSSSADREQMIKVVVEFVQRKVDQGTI